LINLSINSPIYNAHKVPKNLKCDRRAVAEVSFNAIFEGVHEKKSNIWRDNSFWTRGNKQMTVC